MITDKYIKLLDDELRRVHYFSPTREFSENLADRFFLPREEMWHAVRVYWLFKRYEQVLDVLADGYEYSRTAFCQNFVNALWRAGLYSVVSEEVLERAYFHVQAARSVAREAFPDGAFESPSWADDQKMLMAEHSVYMILDDIQYIVPFVHGKTFDDYKDWNTAHHHGRFDYAPPIQHIAELIEAIKSGGREASTKAY